MILTSLGYVPANTVKRKNVKSRGRRRKKKKKEAREKEGREGGRKSINSGSRS